MKNEATKAEQNEFDDKFWNNNSGLRDKKLFKRLNNFLCQ